MWRIEDHVLYITRHTEPMFYGSYLSSVYLAVIECDRQSNSALKMFPSWPQDPVDVPFHRKRESAAGIQWRVWRWGGYPVSYGSAQHSHHKHWKREAGGPVTEGDVRKETEGEGLAGKGEGSLRQGEQAALEAREAREPLLWVLQPSQHPTEGDFWPRNWRVMSSKVICSSH